MFCLCFEPIGASYGRDRFVSHVICFSSRRAHGMSLGTSGLSEESHPNLKGRGPCQSGQRSRPFDLILCTMRKPLCALGWGACYAGNGLMLSIRKGRAMGNAMLAVGNGLSNKERGEAMKGTRSAPVRFASLSSRANGIPRVIILKHQYR